jgi:hypothetical protein
MNKFKVEFTLKQHTPIIHFQSDQTGATLRATELKPKFDKFLLDKVEDLPYKENANGHKSLDYKVKIEPNISKASDINQRESLFFGNMGDGEEKKYKSYTKPFKIEFFSYNKDITKAIKNNFEAFLANINFGTRQSKGYGSFYIADRPFDKSLIPYKVYRFNSKNWEKDIKLLYSFLRQGVNLPNREGTRFYSKPAIFSYAKSKGWTWDKKAIKKKYFRDKLVQQSGDAVEYDSNQQYILRDLFGLSSDQSWMSYKTTVSKENKDIERFKSPINFKIIDDKVYFWADDSYKKILDKEFEIKSNKKGDLKLPTPPEFDFNDFFDFTFKINLSQHIENKYHNQSEYAILKKIFTDIKAGV